MFGSLGFTELILILFIVLIIFGAGKLPQLGEGIGKAIKGFANSKIGRALGGVQSAGKVTRVGGTCLAAGQSDARGPAP